MTTVVLLCVVMSALAGGVLMAHALCVGMFKLFRIHSIQVAQQRIERAESARALQAADLAA